MPAKIDLKHASKHLRRANVCPLRSVASVTGFEVYHSSGHMNPCVFSMDISNRINVSMRVLLTSTSALKTYSNVLTH